MAKRRQSRRARTEPEFDDAAPSARRGGRARGPSTRKRTRGRPVAPRRNGGGLFGGIGRYCLIGTIWCFIGLFLVTAYFALDLPDISRLNNFARRPQVTFFDRTGAHVTTYGDVFGKRATLATLPKHLPLAIMAIEDRRFFDHWGIDPFGVARAAYVNLTKGGIRQGGSTLTQQLAKVVFLTNKRSLKRKVQEALLALWLEQNYTKREILTIFLNRVYLGAGTYGVDAASRRYFGVGARKLNLYQSALLAGLLKAPSRFNPIANPKAAIARAGVVLDAMVDAGFISSKRARGAARHKGILAPARDGANSRYFTDWAMERLNGHVSIDGRDLNVRTTMSPSMQRLAERHINYMIGRYGPQFGVTQGAMVVMTPEGAVKAIVGGVNYSRSQFNRATHALRQPGSAFKTFVMLAAFRRGVRPGTVYRDRPIRVGRWKPRNYKNKYYGEVSVRTAMARSLNSVAVRMMLQVGHNRVKRVARQMGINSKLRGNGSLALGTSEVTLLELTGAYAVLANGGRRVKPYVVVEVRARNGRRIYRRRKGPGPRVLDRRHVASAHRVLSHVVSSGTGRRAKIRRPAAGKTGTSQKSKDAWFIGYTNELVVGIWVGNDKGTPMKQVTGGRLPAMIWSAFMRDALAGSPAKPLRGSGD